MLIVTNCLTAKADEGCLKVAVSLVRRIKEADPETRIIGYERRSELCDQYLPINKWMLNWQLIKQLRKRKEPVLFIPFSAKMRSTALRTFVLSLFAPKGVWLLQSMYSPVDLPAKLLMKLSRARLITLSQLSYQYYKERFGEKVSYLKTGVDTQRFCPSQQKKTLRREYALPEDKIIVLHVGHMKPGRNIEQMMKLDERFHGVLVVSTHTPQQQDAQLRERLMSKKNLTVIEAYLPQIQQLYQLADVYLFPVVQPKGCIDVPLSALEAAACSVPVVTTAFGELQQLVDEQGFYRIEEFEEKSLNQLLEKAAQEGKDPRPAVLEYDWSKAVARLLASQ